MFSHQRRSDSPLAAGWLNKHFLMTWAKGHQCRGNAAVGGIQDSSRLCGWTRDKEWEEVEGTSVWLWHKQLGCVQKRTVMSVRGLKDVVAGHEGLGRSSSIRNPENLSSSQGLNNELLDHLECTRITKLCLEGNTQMEGQYAFGFQQRLSWHQTRWLDSHTSRPE